MANNWAIVIGINQYQFLQPLKYAKRDAELMSVFLQNEAKFDHIFLFTDDSAPIGEKITAPFRSNLLRVLRQIFATPFMKNGDNFWFFFSGHGILHKGQDYLMPLDGDPEDIENTGISTNTITNYLRGCGADNTVMILDACRSGGKKSGEGIGKQTEVEARQTGVISLFSCSPEQYSYEVEAIGQGAFTYALIEGMGIRGRCATVERLNQYLEHRVPELVAQHLGRVKQVPYTIAEPLDRFHLILMPQHASLADIATLKNDAYHAQLDENWNLAEQLWIRVLAIASGQDIDAVRALQKIAIKRNIKTISSQSEQTTWEASRQNERLSSLIPISLMNLSSIPLMTRQQFLKWIVPMGVGIIGAVVASKSLTYVDYSKLEAFLEEGQWKEADKETADLMLKVANREKYGYLDSNSIQRFPCDVLHKIDRLWKTYSQGKFGFSTQRKIYIEDCRGNPNGQYDDEAWQCFGNAVGWSVNRNWISYSDLTFDISAKAGHLPASVQGYWNGCWNCGLGRDRIGGGELSSRVATCTL